MNARVDKPPVTLADRLATAAGSAFLAALTLFVAYMIARHPSQWIPWPYSEFEVFFSERGLVCGIGGAAVVGFLIGPRIMAEIWGGIWSVFDSGPKNPW